MELLAGYSDDGDSGKNTPNFDRFQQVTSKSNVGPMNEGSCNLEAEWESFEKMIGGQQESKSSSSSVPVGVAPPSLTPILGEATIDMNNDGDDVMPILTKMTRSPFKESRRSSTSSSSSVSRASSVESDKITGHNASTHNYDSLSDEEDGENPLKDVFRTKSRSSSPIKQQMSRSSTLSKSPEEVPSRSPSPAGKSKSRSKSKSPSSAAEQKKSRSRSPSLKRRRSSDNKHSRSRSRDRRRGSHSDKRHRRSRSRSHDRKRHSSRERRKHKDRHRRRSHSTDRKSSRSKGHRRSRSRDRKSSKTRDRKRSRSLDSKGRDRKPSRSKSQEKKHSRSKSRERKHSRSKSRDRRNSTSKAKERRRSRSKDRRHSRSRSRDRRRSKERKYKSKRRSRSRDRSRSRSFTREGPRVTRAQIPGKNKPVNFKEKMRQQLFNASKLLTEQGGSLEGDPKDSQKDQIARLDASTIYKNMSAGVTPQMALLQTMAAMHQKAQEITGVAVPKYYNPAAVNPLKYAEQVQKRKLLWSKNKEKKVETESTGQWQATAFVADNDGKMTAKFRKLMGIKEDEEQEIDQEKAREADEIRKKQEELFYHLDKEYEFARMTTHTQRGVGLGFASQTMPHQ